jgi:hypothetical protein
VALAARGRDSAVAAPLLDLPRRYEQTAVPFDWRFTRADLHDLLRRLDEKSSSPNQHDIHPGTSR